MSKEGSRRHAKETCEEPIVNNEQRVLLIGAIKHLKTLHSPAWADAVSALRDELEEKTLKSDALIDARDLIRRVKNSKTEQRQTVLADARAWITRYAE